MIRSVEYGQFLLSATRTKIFGARRSRSGASTGYDSRGWKIIDNVVDDDCTTNWNGSSSIFDISESSNVETSSSTNHFTPIDVVSDKIPEDPEEGNDRSLGQEQDQTYDDYFIPIEDTESKIQVSSVDDTKRDYLMDDGRIFQDSLERERRHLKAPRGEIDDGDYEDMEPSDSEEEEQDFLLNVWRMQ